MAVDLRSTTVTHKQTLLQPALRLYAMSDDGKGPSDRVAEYVDRYGSDSGDFDDIPLLGGSTGQDPSFEAVAESKQLEQAIEDTDPIVTKRFVVAVVFANVGLLSVSLGAMFIVFRGDLNLGGVLLVIGLFAIAQTYRQYRAHNAYVVGKAD